MKPTKEYCRSLISATSKKEATLFADTLLTKNLIAGCMIDSGQTRYWWNGKVVQKKYWNLWCFTKGNNKNKIVRLIEQRATDKVPIIVFMEIDANKKFLDWIDENVR